MNNIASTFNIRQKLVHSAKSSFLIQTASSNQAIASEENSSTLVIISVFDLRT